MVGFWQKFRNFRKIICYDTLIVLSVLFALLRLIFLFCAGEGQTAMITPSQQVAQAGQTVTFNCTVSIPTNSTKLWQRIYVGDNVQHGFYVSDLPNQIADARISVETNGNGQQYNLVIRDVVLADAGTYSFSDGYASAVTAQLAVIGNIHHLKLFLTVHYQNVW